MVSRTTFTTTILIALALSVSAHDTWLLPARTIISPGTKIRFDLTSGMKFPVPETAIKMDRLQVARCRLKGSTFDLPQQTLGRNSLLLETTFTESGLAVVWVDLKPRALELTPKQVGEYLEEIDAPPSVRDAWTSAGPTRRWREIYTKHSKTYIAVGDIGSDRSWSEPVGMALEIVVERNPTSLRAGNALPVRVMKNGLPVPDFPVGIVHANSVYSKSQKTDNEGRVMFKLPFRGRWMVRGTELRPSNKPDTEWESDFTTLTIEVH